MTFRNGAKIKPAPKREYVLWHFMDLGRDGTGIANFRPEDEARYQRAIAAYPHHGLFIVKEALHCEDEDTGSTWQPKGYYSLHLSNKRIDDLSDFWETLRSYK